MKESVDAGPLFAPALRVLSGGDTSGYMLTSAASKADVRVIARYAAAPSLADPRVLLALGATPAAWRAALEQQANGAASRSARAAARLLKLTSFIGLGATLFRDRIALVTSGNQSESPLHQFLGEVLGRNDFVTNLRIAPGRPNSKPVVQVVASEGKALAYAKFGWDGLTSRLIRHEAKVLSGLAPLIGGTGLHIPLVLRSGDWNGLEVLVVAPLEEMGKTPRKSADAAAAASIAVAGIRTRSRARLVDSAFWRRVVGEVEQTALHMDPPTGETLLAARAAIEERWGEAELVYGQSHGDWIPPNISIRRDGGYNVWDWERGEPDVPIGLDTLQFVLFVETHKSPISAALVRRVETKGRRALLRQNLNPELARLFALLSLLRSLLWFGEARLAGRGEADDPRFTRLLKAFLTAGQNGSVSGSTEARSGRTRPQAAPPQSLA